VPVDFSHLVHGPVLDTFGEEVIVDPVDSRPGHPPYKARAVYRSIFLDVLMMDGTALGEQKTTVFFRLNDFVEGIPGPETIGPTPRPRDIVTARGFRYFLSDIDDDGQDGQNIRMILVQPEYRE
jgi:hypothetical protein